MKKRLIKIEQYYKELLKLEPIWLQRYNNGFHTKRVRCETIKEIELYHKQGYNHRKIGINEVVFDIDCYVMPLSQQLWQKISTALEQDNISHFVFFTSKSYHIHSLFKGLNKFSQEDRKQLKLLIIKHYAKEYSVWCDKNMANENCMIRDFNSIHEETNKPNRLIYEFNKNGLVNAINPQIQEIFEKRCKTLNDTEKIENSQNNAITDSNLNPLEQGQLKDFVEFCLAHRFDTQGMYKHQLLFKNIAIAIYILNYTNKQIEEVSKKMGMNCKGHHHKEVIGWIGWCRQQKHNLKVNWNEVKQFYKK